MAPLVKTEPGKSNLLLDLDFTFRRNSNIELWDQIDGIRPVKDRIFMETITPRLQDLLNARD